MTTVYSARADLSLKVAQPALLKALAAAVAPIENNANAPVLTHVLLRAEEGGALVVTGRSYDIETTAKAEADVARGGGITAPARQLHDIVKKMRPDTPISIEGNPERFAATIASGRSRFVLSGCPSTDFPLPTEQQRGGVDSFSAPIEVAGSILASMISRCQFAISSEETRHYLNGIYTHCVTVDGVPTLRFVATDGHKLARIDTTRATGLDPELPGVILPRKAVELFKKLGDTAGDGLVSIEISRSLVRASAGAVSIVSRLIEGTFPDYGRVIPTDFGRECVAPTVALIEAVARVAAVSTETGRGIKLSFSRDHLSVNIKNTEGSEATDIIDVELEGDPIDIGFSSKFLAEVLPHTGGDTVRIKLGVDSTKPAVIGDRFAEALFVLMPMRI